MLDASEPPSHQGTSHQPDGIAEDFAELECLSKRAMNVLFNERDYTNSIWERYLPTYKHYIHDGALITIFSVPNYCAEEGITLSDLFKGVETMYSSAPETKFEFTECHASSKPQSPKDKRKRSTYVDVFVTFNATGLPIGKGGVGICVFKWARRQEQWVCLKSTSLSSSLAYH